MRRMMTSPPFASDDPFVSDYPFVLSDGSMHKTPPSQDTIDRRRTSLVIEYRQMVWVNLYVFSVLSAIFLCDECI
jgi:hypothetical protein